jgi:hypothetical protein
MMPMSGLFTRTGVRLKVSRVRFVQLEDVSGAKPAWEDVMDTEKQPRDLLTNDQELSAEYWQARVERLQEVVCFLLMKNQTMRMVLSVERQPNHSASP